MIKEDKSLKYGEVPAYRHSIPIQIRFNDVDILGHINNSVYFSYYDLGKTAYFRTVRKDLSNWNKIDVVIANVNCNFYAPIFFGEPISVITCVESIKEKSFKMSQRLVNLVTKEVKSECTTTMVGFDPVSQTAARLSEKWVKALCEYEGRNLLEANKEK